MWELQLVIDWRSDLTFSCILYNACNVSNTRKFLINIDITSFFLKSGALTS